MNQPSSPDPQPTPSSPDPQPTPSSIPPLEPSPNVTPAFNELLQKMNEAPASNPPEVVRPTEESSESQTLSSRRQQVRPRTGQGLSAKAIVGASAATALPLLIVGIILYLGGQSLKDRANQGTISPEEIQQTSTTLGLGAVGLALATGAIATLFASRATREITTAATTSNALINRLRREDLSAKDRAEGGNDLMTLNSNLQILDQQLPQLLSNQEAEAERLKILMEMTQRLREARSEEDALRIAVTEVRQRFRADRVTVFRFQQGGEGVFVEESVAQGWPKLLWSTVHDPCFSEGYIEKYREGRVRAIDNIYTANLGDCHVGLLERFGVKANLVAPILQNNQLFGLLIAHQCSDIRFWQAVEIDVFAQIAAQVGVALDYARLLGDIDQRATQSQLFIDVTRRIRTSLNIEDVLKVTVNEVRKAINSDRVIVYSFDPQWYGTVVAEAVLPGYPKALWAKIKDPCFAEGYVEKYQSGRVEATPNIYEAGLTRCHLQQLEPFAVKANLVAPIIKDKQLFGLLIAHQCAEPRHWLSTEVDWFAQIAMQVGFAIDHARLLEQVNAESVQSKALADITRQIRTSLVEDDVVKTTVTEVRRALQADRVIVYSFDAEWYGTVVAEAVVPGYPKALWAKIKDPCFTKGYVDQYRDGRVKATANIETEGLTRCHLSQLEPFGVRANLVAPILKDDQLFGLLIAHQCSEPRDWQAAEIDLFSQVAVQVGFALDHARLLEQVEQAYQTSEAASEDQRHQREILQHQIADWIQHSDPAVKELSAQMLGQMEGVTTLYHHIKLMMTETQTIQSALTQQVVHTEHAHDLLQQGHQLVETLEQHLATTQDGLNATTQKVRQLSEPTQKLSETTQFINQITSQMKLQAMNAALEATRMGDSAQDFASIGEKVLDLARQLDTKIAELTSVLSTLQMHLSGTVAAAQQDAQQIQPELQRLEQIKQTFEQMVSTHTEMQSWLEAVGQSTQLQAESSATANQVVLEVASRANQASEQAIALSSTLDQLTALSGDESS